MNLWGNACCDLRRKNRILSPCPPSNGQGVGGWFQSIAVGDDLSAGAESTAMEPDFPVVGSIEVRIQELCSTGTPRRRGKGEQKVGGVQLTVSPPLPRPMSSFYQVSRLEMQRHNETTKRCKDSPSLLSRSVLGRLDLSGSRPR